MNRNLRERALAFLARREYSRNELRHKLQPYAGERDDLDALLDDLAGRGWLSDVRFVEQVVHARKGKYGSLRIAQELREKGVAEEDFGDVLRVLRDEDLVHAREVWRRKFGSPPADLKERAKQMRFLQSRGFGLDVIRRVLGGEDEE